MAKIRQSPIDHQPVSSKKVQKKKIQKKFKNFFWKLNKNKFLLARKTTVYFVISNVIFLRIFRFLGFSFRIFPISPFFTEFLQNLEPKTENNSAEQIGDTLGVQKGLIWVKKWLFWPHFFGLFLASVSGPFLDFLFWKLHKIFFSSTI